MHSKLAVTIQTHHAFVIMFTVELLMHSKLAHNMAISLDNECVTWMVATGTYFIISEVKLVH